MFDSLSPFLQSLLISILIGVGGSLLAFLVSLLFSRLSKRTWLRFFGNLIAAGIVIWTIKLILDTAGAVGFVVILGTALTGAITLGSEHVASDLVAGLKLFLSRPFKAGDYVSIAGQSGEVAEVALTFTALHGEAGDRVIVRNSDVVSGTIFNYSTRPVYRIEVQISVPASQDLEKAIEAILEAVKDFSPQSAEEDTRPGAVCEVVSDGLMNLKVYAHVSAGLDLSAERTRLMVTALRALRQKKIELSA
jgi:small conductance mechanosensitive channel